MKTIEDVWKRIFKGIWTFYEHEKSKYNGLKIDKKLTNINRASHIGYIKALVEILEDLEWIRNSYYRSNPDKDNNDMRSVDEALRENYKKIEKITRRDKDGRSK